MIESWAYYEAAIKFNLFSPQSYFLTLKSEGDFIMNKNGVFFNFNENDCIKISFTVANLPIAYSTHPVGVTSGDMALITCATNARNVNLPQNEKQLLQWHYRLGHCSFKLVRWLASKGYIKGGHSFYDKR